MKNVVLFLVLAAAALSASGLQVAGSNPGLCRLIPDSRSQILDCRRGDHLEDTTVIAYDDGIHQTWWCSDKDSFGAAVRFTPAGYPCYVVGARAEVGWDTTTGSSQIYLRLFDDDGTSGLPGAILYEEHRTDVPGGNRPGFRDYDLTSPVTIDSGDFYLCFWQKHYFNMMFGTDTHFDSISRQWWFFPDQGWVTPTGMDAADHLIRARVLYSTGVEEDLAANRVPRTDQPLAGIVHGVLMLPRDMTETAVVSDRVPRPALLDANGRKVLDLQPGANDVRALSPGVYFVEEAQAQAQAQAIRKVVIAK